MMGLHKECLSGAVCLSTEMHHLPPLGRFVFAVYLLLICAESGQLFRCGHQVLSTHLGLSFLVLIREAETS